MLDSRRSPPRVPWSSTPFLSRTPFARTVESLSPPQEGFETVMDMTDFFTARFDKALQLAIEGSDGEHRSELEAAFPPSAHALPEGKVRYHYAMLLNGLRGSLEEASQPLPEDPSKVPRRALPLFVAYELDVSGALREDAKRKKAKLVKLFNWADEGAVILQGLRDDKLLSSEGLGLGVAADLLSVCRTYDAVRGHATAMSNICCAAIGLNVLMRAREGCERSGDDFIGHQRRLVDYWADV